MDDINTQLHGIEVGCSWCKVSSIGHHKLTRPTNISIRRSCCREQIPPPAPSTKEGYLKENLKRWRRKNIYRPAFWKCCLRDSQSTGHVLSSNTNNFGVRKWNLFCKHPSSFVIARTSPLPPVNMTPSLLLAIFKWFPIVNLRWHKCHVSCHILIFPIESLSVSRHSHSQHSQQSQYPGPGPQLDKLWQPHQHRNNWLTEM